MGRELWGFGVGVSAPARARPLCGLVVQSGV